MKGLRQTTVREGLVAKRQPGNLWLVYSTDDEVGRFTGDRDFMPGRDVVPVVMFGLADRAEVRFAVDESALAIWDERRHGHSSGVRGPQRDS